MFETFIINPFITIMTALYGLLGNNIVLAIAVFTVIIRLATSPLLIKQQQSTKAMQELQPKLKKLQEKYKNDREKLAQAQMQLYKEHGVNPLSGCLPLFIQLPILLALYQAIIYALAATPFQLIDLSSRLVLPGLDSLVPLQNMWLGMDLTLPPTVNPVYALAFPALVFVTSWLQTKLIMPAPTNTDPNDQTAQVTRTMSTLMPVMFAMFALSFSVGLSIYFVVGNIVSIVQYSLMGKAEWGKLFGRSSTPEPAPAVVTGKVSSSTTNTPSPVLSKAEKRKNKKMRAREAKSS
ncbi:MAG: protein translocase component YidC [Phototrophicales bacterium]|nr:MAG: protein translocase component YidC [Phototrophicales bacterium]RMG75399.1 MAG: membrane protein insertase YidC [Chloroflexota bacterium]